MMEKHYRCWAEIDRSALRHNVAFVREKFGRDIDLIAVVKANAYGHGMIEVAQTIADQANIFGVANLEEATALRAAVRNPIIILGPALPGERAAVAERRGPNTGASAAGRAHGTRIADRLRPAVERAAARVAKS